MDASAAKAERRAHFREALRALSRQADERRSRQERLQTHLVEALRAARGRWAAYRPLAEEADPLPALRPEIEWAFPAVVGDDLEFRIPKPGANAFAVRGWGISEPAAEHSTVAPTAALAGFLVPALAYDRAGRRLGRGRGYYDRCLQGAQGFRLGVAYATQLSPIDLPSESHDARMDAVVTDEGIIWSGDRRI